MTFRLRFIGLCHLVENSITSSALKLGVILIDASQKGEKGLDDTPLVPHRSYIIIPANHISGLQDQNKANQVIVYLKGLKFTPRLIGPTITFPTVDFAGIAGSFIELEKITGTYYRPDTNIVKTPPSATVSSQCFLPGGKFLKPTETTGINTLTWTIPNTLTQGEPPSTVSVGVPLVYEIGKCSAVSLDFAKLDSTALDPIKIVGQENDIVEITVANLCDVDPLGWGDVSENQRDDQDFKWHFRMLDAASAQARIRQYLNPGLTELPIPRVVVPSNPGNGRGIDCNSSFGAPMPF